MENVLAARQAADKNEDKCDEIARYVARMQDMRDYYNNEMKVSKKESNEMEKAEAKRNFIIYNQLCSEAHTKWSEALNSQVELWQKYCDLLEEYEEKEKNAERPDQKCSFCGMMHSECDDDHSDEMRQIIRENSPWTRR